MTSVAQQSRIDALIRLVGLIILAFGVALTYLTYSNATAIAPAIATLGYSLGALLLIVGGIATIAKLK